MLADLLGLQCDRGQAAALQGAEVEQEPDAAGAAGPGMPEVHACEPAAAQLDPALLTDLAAARLPGRLPVRFHDAAWNRPAGLVSRLQNEQAARSVEDEGAGGYRNPRQRRVLGCTYSRRATVAYHATHGMAPGGAGTAGGAGRERLVSFVFRARGGGGQRGPARR